MSSPDSLERSAVRSMRYGRGMNGGVPPKEIRVMLPGTASGPRVHVAVAGIRTLVEAGGEREEIRCRILHTGPSRSWRSHF